jgi:predicted nuclease with TOPRIM domain
MATIEKLYEAKNENQFLKFKIETLEKENSELKTELYELENELELSEVEEDGGVLGGIVEQFKKDPTNTINFAKSMLNDYLKK